MPELARWQSGSAGEHAPSLSTQRMLNRARVGLGEIGSEFADATRLFRTEPETFAQPLPRQAHTLQDVTFGLGLPTADEISIWRAVDDANPAFDQGSQRLLHARSALIEWFRSKPEIPADVRQELTLRATAYWSFKHAVDLNREASMRYVVKSEQPGHKYIARHPDGRGSWYYEYPPEHAAAAGPSVSFAEAKERVQEAMRPLHAYGNKTFDKTPNELLLNGALKTLHQSANSKAEKKEAASMLREHLAAARTHMTNMRGMRQTHQSRPPADRSRMVHHEHAAAAVTVRDMLDAAKTAISRKAESKAAGAGREKRSEQNAKKYSYQKAAELYKDVARWERNSPGSAMAKRADAVLADHAKSHEERFKEKLPGYVAHAEKKDRDAAERRARRGGPDLDQYALGTVQKTPEGREIEGAYQRRYKTMMAAGGKSEAVLEQLTSEMADALHRLHYRQKREAKGQGKLPFDKSMRPTLAVRVHATPMRLEF